MKNIEDFLLTGDITVGETRQWISNKNAVSKTNLINLINHRFHNRYIKHLNNKDIDSGFLKMAISCLMIETLESFKQGKENTKGIGKQMFIDFFETEEKFFPSFKEISSDFYISIRCGILHQAETTNAWRILRKGNLLNQDERTINASKFVESLGKVLDSYINILEESDFDSNVWENAILKIEDICKNCEVSN